MYTVTAYSEEYGIMKTHFSTLEDCLKNAKKALECGLNISIDPC